MKILIRRGCSEDANLIARFQCDMALETENKRLNPEIVLPAVESVFEDRSKGFYLVAEVDDVVVGNLMITFEWSDWRNCSIWYIQSVYVESDLRGRGVFTRLYEHVVELARDSNVMFVRLYVEVENKRAQKTYERLGLKRMPYYMYDVKIT